MSRGRRNGSYCGAFVIGEDVTLPLFGRWWGSFLVDTKEKTTIRVCWRKKHYLIGVYFLETTVDAQINGMGKHKEVAGRVMNSVVGCARNGEIEWVSRQVLPCMTGQWRWSWTLGTMWNMVSFHVLETSFANEKRSNMAHRSKRKRELDLDQMHKGEKTWLIVHDGTLVLADLL